MDQEEKQRNRAAIEHAYIDYVLARSGLNQMKIKFDQARLRFENAQAEYDRLLSEIDRSEAEADINE